MRAPVLPRRLEHRHLSVLDISLKPLRDQALSRRTISPVTHSVRSAPPLRAISAAVSLPESREGMERHDIVGRDERGPTQPLRPQALQQVADGLVGTLPDEGLGGLGFAVSPARASASRNPARRCADAVKSRGPPRKVNRVRPESTNAAASSAPALRLSTATTPAP